MSTALTRNDTAWFRMDSPVNLMVVTGFFEFDDPVSLDTIKLALRDGFLRYDRFKQRVVERSAPRAPRWVDDESFELDDHVVAEALSEPGDDDALKAAIEAHVRTPLDPHKPLWRMTLLTGHGSGCVLLFRIHHCIADGMALLQVLLAMCEQIEGAGAEAPQSKPRRPAWFWPALPITGTWWLLRYLVSSNYLMVRRRDSDSPFKGETEGVKKLAWASPLPLDEVKATAAAAGVKINDLLMATATGALRRYSETRGVALDDKVIRVMVPVNLRSAKAANQLGNRFALVTPGLPVDRSDAAERVAEVKRRMDRLKGSTEPVSTVVFTNLLGMLGVRLQHRLQRFLVNKTTLSISNVPGPRKRLAFAGQPIQRIMFWVPLFGPTGLGVSIFSYAGEVSVGVLTDEALVPDPQTLADGFEEEFRALQRLYRQPAIEA